MPPAARIGDSTVHGGVITVGEVTVLIGGQPAARVTDMHTCPMVTGTVPHVGGPIAKGCTSVLIGPMLAARIGDMATCTGPPDTIATGEMTVLIGDLTGGGGGGAAAAQTATAALEQAEVLQQARRDGAPYCEINPDLPPSQFSTEVLADEPRRPDEQRKHVLTCDLQTLTLKCGHAERGFVLQVGELDATGVKAGTLEVVAGPDGDEIEVTTALSKPYCTKHLERPIVVSRGAIEGLAATPPSATGKFKAEPVALFREQLRRNPFALLWPQFAEKNTYNVLAPTCGLTRSAKVVVYPGLHWEVSLGLGLGRDVKKRKWSSEREAKIQVKYGNFHLDYGQKLTQYINTALSAAETAAGIIDKTSHALDRWAGAKLKPLLPNIEITGEWGWREVPGDWRAGYELKVTAEFSPLIGLSFELDIITAILTMVGSPLVARLKKLFDKLAAEVGIFFMADGTLGGRFAASRMLGQVKPTYDGSVEGRIELAIEGRIKAEKKWVFFSVSVDVRAGGRSGITGQLRPVADRTGFGVRGEVFLDEGQLYFHGAASAGFELFQEESGDHSESGTLGGGGDMDRSHTLWKKTSLADGTAYFVKNGNANA